jgi:hypothetical protein
MSRRPLARLNRGRVADTSGDGSNPALNAPTLAVEDGVGETHVADEGDDLTALATVDDGDGSTTLDVELYDNGVLVDSMDDDGGGAWSYALTDVLPGTHTHRAKRITADGFRWSATWLVTVAAEVPSLDAPLDAATVTIGDPLTFEATGTVDGFDANTTKMEFYVESVLRATALTDTVGVWTEDWDTTGATPAVGQVVLARRYWLGVSGQAGTADSVDDVEIELEEGGAAPVLVSAEIDATGLELTLTYDQALDDASVPDPGDFALDGTTSEVDSVDVDGMTVVLTLDTAVFSHETVTIDYTAGADPIQNAAAQAAANLTDEPVTNGSTVFSPAGIPDLVFWGDMLNPASFTEAAGIITARSNVVSAVGLTPTNSPGYQATGLNSLPAADYPGLSQTFFIGNEAAVVAAGVDANPWTAVMVVALNTIDRLENMFGWGNSGVANNGTIGFGQTTISTGRLNMSFVNDAGTTVTVSGSAQTDTTAHVYAFRFTGSTIDNKIDDVTDVTPQAFTPGTNTPNRFAIASRPDNVPDRRLDGQEGETLIYGRDLTDGELTQLATYLKAKWGTP